MEWFTTENGDTHWLSKVEYENKFEGRLVGNLGVGTIHSNLMLNGVSPNQI